MHERLPPNDDEAQAMRARFHLAPPLADAPEQTAAAEVEEVIPRPVSARELGYTSYAGCVVYHFPHGAVIHGGIARAVTERLKSRNPMLSAKGADLHLSFGIEDDSEQSQARVALVAERLHELLPNAVLGEVSIGYMDLSDTPRRTPPYLIDVTDYGPDLEP